jgi:hypothetical protein
MLHEFITSHREQIIERARVQLKERLPPDSSEAKFQNGIPLFIGQLSAALLPGAPESSPSDPLEVTRAIGESAAVCGHELLRNGYTVGEVVHGYGDVCQIVTGLAKELNTAISAADFQVFNRCLDDAIAGAVTAHAQQRERDLVVESKARFALLTAEMRNILITATLSFEILRGGVVGIGGSTGAIHSRALSELRLLVERSLADTRIEEEAR